MILFDPKGRLTVCTESARIVDKVYVIYRPNADIMMEDGEGRVVVFRNSSIATEYRKKHSTLEDALALRWMVYEFQGADIDLILSRPHICIGES